MAPIRYSLHYEDYSEHVISRFGKLLQMQSLVDMTLMCNSHTLRVHKVVLAASSAYFQEVLQKQSGEPLIILKMRFNVLKCLVEFMYCGKTQCLEENLDELVAAAQFLKIKGLSKVTKEGLGITSHGELPVFTPPVVIDRPPQSLVDFHSQECAELRQAAPLAGSGTTLDDHNRPNKDMVMRIPFDISCGAGGGGAGVSAGAGAPELGLDYSNTKPRRGRPISKHGVWESGIGAGPAPRALQRRDHDSRKAFHRLRHLHPRHLQDYMDSVSLSQAVNSICGPETGGGTPYTEVGNDFMYMEQSTVDPTINAAVTCEVAQPAGASFADAVPGVNTVMSQYVNALKSAGLPTDLPILFEAGDGTYINVNEQVLLDMVQSGEIQYEVIEQPNIIDKVADPNEIKSIDDLSKSIERGEILLDAKNYTSTSNYDKVRSQTYGKDMEGMESLDAILSDNLESFDTQQNYVVLEPRLQDSTTLQNVNAPDFSCMDGDIQFFTKTMNDDVKKYYEDQQLNEAKAMEELCSTNSTLDTNYAMSLLDAKTTHLMTDNMESQYNAYNTEDLRQGEEYDFGLQLPQNNDFKSDPLDSLVDSAKESLSKNEQNLSPKSQEQLSNTNNCDSTNNLGDGMLNDLIDFEHKIDAITQNNFSSETKSTDEGEKFPTSELITNENDFKLDNASRNNNLGCSQDAVTAMDTTDDLPASTLEGNWKEVLANNKTINNVTEEINKNNLTSVPFADSGCNYVDLTMSKNIKTECMDESYNEVAPNTKENVCPNSEDNINTASQNDIPFAVGLLPLKQIQSIEEIDCYLKRKNGDQSPIETDTKSLKRKLKCKKM